MISLISNAYAQEAAAAMQEPSAIAGLMPILLILVVFYFLLIRPQQKKYKEHLAMVNAVSKGDEIVTSGGIIGKVTKVDADKNTLHVSIADGVEVKVIRSTISGVLKDEKPVAANDSTPAKAAAKPAAKKTPAKKATKA